MKRGRKEGRKEKTGRKKGCKHKREKIKAESNRIYNMIKRMALKINLNNKMVTGRDRGKKEEIQDR